MNDDIFTAKPEVLKMLHTTKTYNDISFTRPE